MTIASVDKFLIIIDCQSIPISVGYSRLGLLHLISWCSLERYNIYPALVLWIKQWIERMCSICAHYYGATRPPLVYSKHMQNYDNGLCQCWCSQDKKKKVYCHLKSAWRSHVTVGGAEKTVTGTIPSGAEGIEIFEKIRLTWRVLSGFYSVYSPSEAYWSTSTVCIDCIYNMNIVAYYYKKTRTSDNHTHVQEQL